MGVEQQVDAAAGGTVLGVAWTSIRVTLVSWVLCGLVFPLVIVGLGSLLFPHQAAGSLIRNGGGRVIGSSLIGQEFTSARWFHGRPSATTNPRTGKPEPYAANNSGATNFGPTNAALENEVRTNLQTVLAANPGLRRNAVPLDLVESSGSGLDPDVFPPSAMLQVPRVAAATGLSQAALRALVARETHNGPFIRLFGAPYVNVLDLNVALAALEQRRAAG